jgi:hypothetical protein
VELSVQTPAGDPIQGDHVHFSVGAESGTGQCGTLGTTDEPTDADGFASVTYTASSDNVACWVLAVDADHGQSSQAVVYQGTTRKNAETFTAVFPTSLQAGGSPRIFTVRATNPTSQPVPSNRVAFIMFPADGTTLRVDANQVHLAYSTTGPNGPFTPVALYGSTAAGNAIVGHIAPPQLITLPAASSVTFTFRISLAHNVPTSKTTPLLALEAYLDQLDTASGSGATLGDTYATEVSVQTAALSSNTLRNVLIAIAMALVVLAIAGLMLWQRHRHPPQAPPAQPVTP